MDGRVDDELPPFASLLDGLFDRHRKPNGRRYTNEEVATAVEASTGISIAQSYISMLRRGERADPRGSHIQGLASFFGVPAGYFLDVETYRQVERGWVREAELGAEIQVPEARKSAPGVMLRKVTNLSPELRQIFGELIDRVSELDNHKGE